MIAEQEYLKNKHTQILIADDDPGILEILQYNLSKEGYNVHAAADGYDCINKANICKPDLILLDVMMPGLDGMETCRQLRTQKEFDDTLIVILSARAEEYSILAAYEAGANDYLTKPIKPRVLSVKLSALLKLATNAKKQNQIKVGNLLIDLSRYSVFSGGKEIPLAKREFELLQHLATKPGHVFHREEILRSVWKNETLSGSRTIDVHIRKIREKIGLGSIKTIKGVGYKLVIRFLS